jgi:hypothetical protein
VLWIVIISKRKRVERLQPTVVGVTALMTPANLKHVELQCVISGVMRWFLQRPERQDARASLLYY